MKLLENRRVLIAGMLSERSLAYGIASACHRQGASLAFSYAGARTEGRVRELARQFDSDIVLECDVSEDAHIENLFSQLRQHWSHLDGFVHSVAFAPREAIAGDFLEGLSREAFRVAHEVSAYSFAAMAKAAAPMLAPAASLLTLTYLGAQRVVPNYNTMGLAKASLESSIRYLAADLGPRGIRVNGISAGAIKTLASSGVKDLSKLLTSTAQISPLRRNVTIEDVGGAAAFLLSSLASGVTGQVVTVDAGYGNCVAAG